MLSVQPVHLCERGPHSDHVVDVEAGKREKDERFTYFRVVGLGRTFDRITFANAIYGLASLFRHSEDSLSFPRAWRVAEALRVGARIWGEWGDLFAGAGYNPRRFLGQRFSLCGTSQVQLRLPERQVLLSHLRPGSGRDQTVPL